jgi:hypothetical protein
MASCPVCKKIYCKWIDLKPDPKLVPTEELNLILSHNLGVAELILGHGVTQAKKNMWEILKPYSQELRNRRD